MNSQMPAFYRSPDLVDAAGDQMVGTFAGGELLTVEAGDQISLLDDDGAVADTSSV